jgi:hypothetical protein
LPSLQNKNPGNYAPSTNLYISLTVIILGLNTATPQGVQVCSSGSSRDRSSSDSLEERMGKASYVFENSMVLDRRDAEPKKLSVSAKHLSL